MKKIIIDSKIPYISAVLEPYFDVEYLEGSAITPSDLVDVSALVVRTRTVCNRELLEGSGVECIATATIGTDHIDLDYCSARGIEVFNSAGCNASGVVQYVLAAIAAAGLDSSATVGVVGCGNVGGALTSALESMGFTVLCNDTPRRDRGDFKRHVELEEMARRCDAISFHVPLTRDDVYCTYHMASSNFFEMLKPGVMVINSSRGEVVDTPALISAIESGVVATAAIDVWEDEPDIDARLLSLSTLSTAHIAGYSRRGKERATEMAVRNIARHFSIESLMNWALSSKHPEPIALEWGAVSSMMSDFFDINEQTTYLKCHKDEFEQIRASYLYREEFF